MAKKKKQEHKIIFNLLKPVAAPKTSWDTIYDWLLGKARIIIFTVEILIVGAFIGKFIVDTQAKNKDKQIEALRLEESFYTLKKEPEFRLIQSKNNAYITLWNGSSSYYAILSEIYSYISPDIEEINISISTDRVIVSGYDDIEELRIVEESFKNSNTFTDANIEVSLESDDIVADKGRYTLVGYIDTDILTRDDLQ